MYDLSSWGKASVTLHAMPTVLTCLYLCVPQDVCDVWPASHDFILRSAIKLFGRNLKDNITEHSSSSGDSRSQVYA